MNAHQCYVTVHCLSCYYYLFRYETSILATRAKQKYRQREVPILKVCQEKSLKRFFGTEGEEI
jgi:hypothetical protein